MKSFLLVFLGGGFGSGLRFLLSNSMSNYEKIIPIGTFTVNMLGCLMIGFILGCAQKEINISSNYTLLLASGFCGGFTTFSAFANENFNLIKSGELLNFSVYIILSVVVGILLVSLGYFIADKFNFV
tara:strand:- start:614 stop:994 length:381 start_codon:yes stop_codon:yes gene_type:complete